MRLPLPPIHEDVADLKQWWKAERHHGKRQRYLMLYLLASGTVRTRRAAAERLGVDRATVGQWVATYAADGLAALLAVYVPSGKAPALSPNRLVQLQAQLDDPAGIDSYAAVHRWINTTFGLTMTYNAVHKLVRYKLKAKLKVPRPQHPKKTSLL